jgi:D-glycero-D-manno-heptose 1,7-bisphosphate phosphatase
MVLRTFEPEMDFKKMSDKAVFLDRDDTLIEDPGYINDPAQVKLLDGVPDALIQLKALGYKLIVVTNQSGVAHGIVTEKILGDIHDRMKQLLINKNAYLDRIYYCPYHPEGVIPKYRKESDLRKPSPGMLLKAADEMDIDLNQSWCVGNSSRDIEAGVRAGCKTILIDLPPSHQKTRPTVLLTRVNPDYKAVNIKEVVNIIKKHLRSSTEQKQAQPIAVSQAEPVRQEVESISEVAEPSEQVEAQQTAPELQVPEIDIQPNEPETEPVEIPTLSTELQTKPVEPPIRPPEPQEQPVKDIPEDKTEELLSNILAQLKTMQRAEMFGEFSIMRLLAGILQIVVLFCLLVTVWFLMSPDRQDNFVFFSLGFAIVFQLMTLTFYMMQAKK